MPNCANSSGLETGALLRKLSQLNRLMAASTAIVSSIGCQSSSSLTTFQTTASVTSCAATAMLRKATSLRNWLCPGCDESILLLMQQL